jgi:hypothetical protein
MKVAAMTKPRSCALHGGTFETSPNWKKGEVSLVRAPLDSGGKRAFAGNGTGRAINYSNSSVAAKSADSPKRGGARNSKDRRSEGLSGTQLDNLIAAKRHANAIGFPFNRMVTIHWEEAGLLLQDMPLATGQFIDRLKKTLERHGSRTAYLWTHEGGTIKGGHCHLLIHVPGRLVAKVTKLQRRWLRKISGKPYRKTVILSRPIGRRIGLEASNPAYHAVNLEVAFGYVGKAASQADLDAAAIDRQHEPGGLVIGKRCGTSQNIAQKARSQGAL